MEILGTTYARLREFDKAIKTYHRALEIAPDLVDARYFLAALGNQAVPAQSPAEYVTKVFDTYAPRFDRHLLGNLDYQAPQLLRQAVATAIGGGRMDLELLDLGCGTGLCGALFRDIAKYLTGVDLSPKMIQKAREHGIYDELIVGDLLTPLRESNARHDLIIAADVFIYVGDLSQIFATCQIALRPGGLFAFSTECEGGMESYTLRRSGRYAHAVDYIRTLARSSGFEEIGVEQAVIRQEQGTPIDGNIFVFQKPRHAG